MDIQITTCTPNPVTVCSAAAGVCYGKRDARLERLQNCVKRGHMGVLEHASLGFLVEGISRACSHQLVRHRLFSFCQESQRYNKIDTSTDEWFVVPPAFDCASYMGQEYIKAMARSSVDYSMALDMGIKPEDARYLLPEACKTSIVITANLREWFHFWGLRDKPEAQWEIRNIAVATRTEARNLGGEWEYIEEMARYAGARNA